MTTPPNKLSRFWQEVRRRNVHRLMAVYGGTAYIIFEASNMIFPRWGLPDWTIDLVLYLLLLGAIVTFVLGWIYDITPEGVQKTMPVSELQEGQVHSTSNVWKIASYISFVVIIGLIALNVFRGHKGPKINESLAKSIAVLPFHNLSGEDEKEYICDGISEEIIGQLFKVRSFDKVVSFYSVMNYKDPQRNIPNIAEELGVNYILDGSFKRIGDNLKISAQLIDAQNDNHLWLQDFEKPYKDVMGIPGEIALQIAEYLVTYVSKSEKRNIEKAYTNDQEAWDKYQLGSYYFTRSGRDREYLDYALELFEEAIEIDPEFALAYTRLSQVLLRLSWFKFDLSPDILARSREALDIALNTEPELVEAHIQLARYYYQVFLDYPKSLELLKKASIIAPGHSEIFYWTGINYRRMGKWEESTRQLEKAIEIDPRHFDYLQNMADNCWALKTYDKLQTYIRLADEIDSTNFVQYEMKMALPILKEGNIDAAKKVIEGIQSKEIRDKLVNWALYIAPIELDFFEGSYQNALSFIDEAPDWEGLVNASRFQPRSLFQARIYAHMGMHDKAVIYYDSARMEIEEMLELFPRDPRLKGPLGVCFAGLGNKERAIQLGEQAVQEYSLQKDAFFGLMRIEELAWIYVMTGEFDKAVEQVEVLLSTPGYYSVPLLKLDPKWEPLWDHPEFIRLTEEYS